MKTQVQTILEYVKDRPKDTKQIATHIQRTLKQTSVVLAGLVKTRRLRIVSRGKYFRYGLYEPSKAEDAVFPPFQIQVRKEGSRKVFRFDFKDKGSLLKKFDELQKLYPVERIAIYTKATVKQKVTWEVEV